MTKLWQKDGMREREIIKVEEQSNVHVKLLEA